MSSVGCEAPPCVLVSDAPLLGALAANAKCEELDHHGKALAKVAEQNLDIIKEIMDEDDLINAVEAHKVT